MEVNKNNFENQEENASQHHTGIIYYSSHCFQRERTHFLSDLENSAGGRKFRNIFRPTK